MNSELGVWRSEECALVLIDYQPELFESIRSETDADLVELHVRLLAKTAKAFDMPIVLTTIGVEADVNSPTQPRLATELLDVQPIDRSSMNAFEDEAFRQAGAATGRKRLIMGGLVTEVCLAFAAVEALKAGYEVKYPTDAVDGRSQIAHRTAIERLAAAGAVPNTPNRADLRALPRLGHTPRRAGPRARQLVRQRSSHRPRPRWFRRAGEAPGASGSSRLDVLPASEKVCVITGTGGSIRHASALALAREGALVVGRDLRVDAAQARASGGPAPAGRRADSPDGAPCHNLTHNPNERRAA